MIPRVRWCALLDVRPAPTTDRQIDSHKMELSLPTPVSFSGLEPTVAEACMDGIIYLIGLIVVIMAILSFFGLH
jgi:hypothetical protein